ncbi:hypothetical protein C6A85_12685, partial [Mycobacterium sp. ITM-2017-0098]
ADTRIDSPVSVSVSVTALRDASEAATRVRILAPCCAAVRATACASWRARLHPRCPGRDGSMRSGRSDWAPPCAAADWTARC